MTGTTLLLVDLMPILYRGHFVFLKNPRRTASGIVTSSLSLFATTLEQMLRLFTPTHMAIALESSGPTFRHTLYPPYKAQREKMPEDIAAAIGQAKELAEAWGIRTVQAEGYEADDVLGTLAARAVEAGFQQVIIATPDKDLGQLAGPHVSILHPGDQTLLSAEELCAKWGISSPEQMIDYLALAGDASDNIPGVPGVGAKTTVKLLATYGTLDNLLAHAGEVKGKTGESILTHAEDARLSKRLVTIVRDAPVAETLDDLILAQLDTAKLAPVLAKYELRQVANRIGIAATAAQTQFGFTAALLESHEETSSTYKTLANVPHDYRLVDTPEAREALAAELMKAPLIAFDTETIGLQPRHDRAVGCSFAIEGGRAWYVPLPEQDEDQRAALAPFLPVFQSETIAKVGHHLRFDRAVLLRLGIELRGPLHDTLLEHYLVDATDRHDLDHVANVFLDYAPIPISAVLGTEKGRTMADVPPEAILDYAAEDADVAFRLHAVLMPKIKEMGLEHLLLDCEEPLAGVLLRMETIGVRLDVPTLRRFRQELEGEVIRQELAIRNYTGAGVNLASPKQLGEFLFGYLKLDPTVKRTSRGQFPTNEELLLKLRDRHPIIDLILDWRACVKLKNTYVDRLPDHIDPADGRIHTTFNQTFTDTGRLSSSNPNLQNIPVRSDRGQRIRAAFVARGPGWTLLSADYSQVELRLMAAMSGDERMIGAFKRGEDIHAQTASVVYGVPLEEVTPSQRSHCKMVNFGIIYGISPFGLASRLRIPRKEAQELIEAYFTQYPAVRAYMDKSIAEARERGYAQTLFGRRRAVPEINSRNASTRTAAERVAINMPIQGSAADIIKFAMVRIDRELCAKGLRAQMTLQIHDELLFDVPEEELEIVRPLVKSAMESVIDLAVPLSVSIGDGPDWLSAH